MREQQRIELQRSQQIRQDQETYWRDRQTATYLELLEQLSTLSFAIIRVCSALDIEDEDGGEYLKDAREELIVEVGPMNPSEMFSRLAMTSSYAMCMTCMNVYRTMLDVANYVKGADLSLGECYSIAKWTASSFFSLLLSYKLRLASRSRTMSLVRKPQI